MGIFVLAWLVIVILLIIVGIGGLIVLILHLIGMQKALDAAPPVLRRMPSGQVWLSLIPLFGLVWQYLVTNAVADTLRAEYARRGLPREEDRPGYGLGLTSNILICAMVIPYIGLIPGVIGIILRIVHLARINNYRRRLEGAGFFPWLPEHYMYAPQGGNTPPPNYNPNFNPNQQYNPGQQYNPNQQYNPDYNTYNPQQQTPPADMNNDNRWMPGQTDQQSDNTNNGGNTTDFWQPPQPPPPVPPIPPAE